MVLRNSLLVVEGSHSYAEDVIFKALMKLKTGKVQVDICLIILLYTGRKTVANALRSPTGTEVRSQYPCPKKNSGIVQDKL